MGQHAGEERILLSLHRRGCHCELQRQDKMKKTFDAGIVLARCLMATALMALCALAPHHLRLLLV